MNESPEFLTVEEAATALKVSRETIRRLTRRGELKAAKVGRVLRISRRDFETYYRQSGGGSAFLDLEPEAATK